MRIRKTLASTSLARSPLRHSSFASDVAARGALQMDRLARIWLRSEKRFRPVSARLSNSAGFQRQPRGWLPGLRMRGETMEDQGYDEPGRAT